MKFLIILLSTLTLGFASNDTTGQWTEVGADAEGFEIVDITDLSVLKSSKITEQNRIIYVDEELELNDLLKKTGKKKAVIHVVETLPSGGVCGGCVGKGKKIVEAIRADEALLEDTAYFMVISTEGATPSINAVLMAQASLQDESITVIRDIDGQFQAKFATSMAPVTLVLDSQYRGKVLNMHKDQPATVVRTLNLLPKD